MVVIVVVVMVVVVSSSSLLLFFFFLLVVVVKVVAASQYALAGVANSVAKVGCCGDAGSLLLLLSVWNAAYEAIADPPPRAANVAAAVHGLLLLLLLMFSDAQVPNDATHAGPPRNANGTTERLVVVVDLRRVARLARCHILLETASFIEKGSVYERETRKYLTLTANNHNEVNPNAMMIVGWWYLKSSRIWAMFLWFVHTSLQPYTIFTLYTVNTSSCKDVAMDAALLTWPSGLRRCT